MTTDTVLVTGANGHVGNNLVRALLARGHQVRALVFGPAEHMAGLPIEQVSGDLRDPATAGAICQGVDTVFHLAGRISLSMDDWPELEAINVNGVRHMVAAALAHNVRRFVHFSSIHAYQQEPLQEELDERRPLVERHHQTPPYDRSKAAGEREVRKGIEQGLDAVIITPSGILGPHDYMPSHFGNVLLQLANGSLPILIQGGYTWVDVRDVVRGTLLAWEHGRSGEKYMLSGPWLSVMAVSAFCARLTGAEPARLALPMWLARLSLPLADLAGRFNGHQPAFSRASLAALAGNHRISHAKATAELGYQPRPIEETLRDTICWFAGQGMVERPLQLSPDDIKATLAGIDQY